MFCGRWTSYDAFKHFGCSSFEGGRRPCSVAVGLRMTHFNNLAVHPFEGGRRPCSVAAGPRMTHFNNSAVHPSKEVGGRVLWPLDLV